MKLHLGCGERYMDGYVNIDFPPTGHTVQAESLADRHADITRLKFKAGAVEEVRLHHVFEHFSRPQALGLLAVWNAWMKPGGRLHIEVPDFTRTALAALNPLGGKAAQRKAIRHLFGSHEAAWAAHWEGWSVSALKDAVKAFGFQTQRLSRNRWQGIHNFELIALKERGMSLAEHTEAARRFLSDYRVDDSKSEAKLLQVWVSAFESQRKLGWPKA
jgi:hypothetical protein